MRRAMSGQGGNSVVVRLLNERVILTLLRRLGEAARADLARHAGLTSNTAGVIVQELQARGLIRVRGRRRGVRGQPATVLALDPEGAYSIGVRVGRRSIDALLVDLTGEVRAHRHRERAFPLPDEAVSMLLEDVAALRRTLADEQEQRLIGLGLAMPYNMGSWRRELGITSEAHRAWDNYDLAADLGRSTGLAVFAENDGNAAAIAELFQGHGRRLDDFVYLFVGTALGGGVVTQGDCHRGTAGNGGDLGLMPVEASGLATAPRPLGRFDILLNRASLGALIRHLESAGFALPTAAAVEAAIGRRPDLVNEWLDDCAASLAGPVLSAVAVLDIHDVIIDGHLPRSVLRDLIDRLDRELHATVAEARRPPRLREGSIGRRAAAIGAAILPLHVNYSAGGGRVQTVDRETRRGRL